MLAIYLFPSLRARPPSLFIYLFIFEGGYRCTRVHQTPEGPATAQSDGSPASNKPVSYAAPAEQRTAAWARFRPRAERTALQTGEPERDARAQVLHRVLAAPPQGQGVQAAGPRPQVLDVPEVEPRVQLRPRLPAGPEGPRLRAEPRGEARARAAAAPRRLARRRGRRRGGARPPLQPPGAPSPKRPRVAPRPASHEIAAAAARAALALGPRRAPGGAEAAAEAVPPHYAAEVAILAFAAASAPRAPVPARPPPPPGAPTTSLLISVPDMMCAASCGSAVRGALDALAGTGWWGSTSRASSRTCGRRRTRRPSSGRCAASASRAAS